MIFPLVAHSVPVYDFEYSYGDPYLSSSQTYITSIENAVLRSETYYRYWKSDKGGSTFENTIPGIITYHFDFGSMGYTDPVSEIALGINMPIFNWSYSQGHNILYGSADGLSWVNIAEVSFPDDAALGAYLPLGAVTIPDSLLGGSDLWLRAEIYSFGRYAPNGGAMTNTAQLSRYDIANNSTTFRIGVNFDDDSGGGIAIPEPATLALLGLGLVGIGYRRKAK